MPPTSPKKWKAIDEAPVIIEDDDDDDDNEDVPPTPFKTKKKNNNKKKTMIKTSDDASYQPTHQIVEIKLLTPPKKKTEPQPSGNVVLEHIGSNASNNDDLNK